MWIMTESPLSRSHAVARSESVGCKVSPADPMRRAGAATHQGDDTSIPLAPDSRAAGSASSDPFRSWLSMRKPLRVSLAILDESDRERRSLKSQ